MKIYMVIVGIEALNDKFYFDKMEAVQAIVDDVGDEFDEEDRNDIKEYDYYYHNTKKNCCEYYIKELVCDSGMWVPAYV